MSLFSFNNDAGFFFNQLLCIKIKFSFFASLQTHFLYSVHSTIISCVLPKACIRNAVTKEGLNPFIKQIDCNFKKWAKEETDVVTMWVYYWVYLFKHDKLGQLTKLEVFFTFFSLIFGWCNNMMWVKLSFHFSHVTNLTHKSQK